MSYLGKDPNEDTPIGDVLSELSVITPTTNSLLHYDGTTSPVTVPVAGDPLVWLQSAGPLGGFRNKIINGKFDIWQRGTSFTNPNSIYTADRWIGSIGAGTGVTTREAFTPGQTDVPGEPTYYIKINSTNTTGQALLAQKIESVRTLAGKTVTLSFWIKGTDGIILDANYPQIRQNFGVGGSTEVSIINTGAAVTLLPVWQKVVRTFTLPSISGKTIGTDDYLYIIPARKDNVLVEFSVANVQLEEGTVATSFEERPIGLEYSLCLRYYYRTNISIFMGCVYSTTLATGIEYFPVPMRKAPTAIEQSGTAGDYGIFYAATYLLCTAVPTHVASTDTTRAQVTFTGSGLTVGHAVMLSKSANGYLGWSAEI